MSKNNKYPLLLEVEDAVGTRIDVFTADILDEIFCFPYTFYKQMPYGGKKQIKSVKRVIARGPKGYRNMPTGLLPIAVQYLKSKQFDVHVTGYNEYIKPTKPKLPTITFRPDQMQAIKSVMLNKPQRGIIVAPTGTGKTIIALGAVSTVYPKCNILILAHTVDLLNQFYEDLIKFKFKESDISYLKGTDYKFNKITLSTDKKLAKIDPSEYADYFDMVIVDECFDGKTKITMGNNKQKPIKEIKIGEKVKTSMGNKKVTRVFKNKIPLNRLCKITLSNGKQIYSSIDHVFKTKKGEIEAKNLKGIELKINEKGLKNEKTLQRLWRIIPYFRKRSVLRQMQNFNL